MLVLIPSWKLHSRFKLARFEGLKPSRGYEKHEARDVTSSSKSDLFLSSSANYRSRNKLGFEPTALWKTSRTLSPLFVGVLVHFFSLPAGNSLDGSAMV